MIYTIGHSNRNFEEFLRIIEKFKIDLIVDVRRFPSSKITHFNKEFLENKFGEKYLWIEKLGGFRKFGKDITDIGIGKCFRSEGFRAYATYILINEEIRKILYNLLEISKNKNILLMCREKFPWNCHRKILSDWFLSKNSDVIHIIDENKFFKHNFTRCAYIKDGELFYK